MALAFFAGFSERWAQDILRARGVKLDAPDGGGAGSAAQQVQEVPATAR